MVNIKPSLRSSLNAHRSISRPPEYVAILHCSQPDSVASDKARYVSHDMRVACRLVAQSFQRSLERVTILVRDESTIADLGIDIAHMARLAFTYGLEDTHDLPSVRVGVQGDRML